jgi:diaminopropionate ammonia-lyase
VAFAHIPAVRAADILFNDGDFEQQRAFFAARPDLAPTPLQSLPALAERLGLGELLMKDETARFGLNAFKAVGATFAVSTLLRRGAIRTGDTLVCASEGNHGRAVARAARDAGCAARVYMAATVSPARVAAIEGEGAQVSLVDGSYDQAVRRMARDAEAQGWTVISDTGWAGYDEIPRLIMLGYTRLMDEAEASWNTPPDVIFVQAGVGGLLAAVASWAHWRYGPDRPKVVGVEPECAACVQAAVQHGRETTLQGPFDTIMGGLRCGVVSQTAFGVLSTLVDGYVAIEDEWAYEAIRTLARPSRQDPIILAGSSGGASLGGLMATLFDASLNDFQARLRLNADTRALAIVTEGVTEADILDRALSSPSTLPLAEQHLHPPQGGHSRTSDLGLRTGELRARHFGLRAPHAGA